MADIDPLAALRALADSAAAAEQISADAVAMMDAAKMAQIKANQDAASATQRHAEADKRDAAHKAKDAELSAMRAALDAQKAEQDAAAKALAARDKEVTANEARVAKALESAQKMEAQGKSYEGEAYARLERVRQKLAEAVA